MLVIFAESFITNRISWSLLRKKGSQVADIITPLLEMFHLIEKETKSIFSFTEDFNFKQRHFEPGVYLKTKEILNGVETFDGLAIVDIPSGSFRSIVIDSGGGIASSKHTIEQFKELKGRYLFHFILMEYMCTLTVIHIFSSKMILRG